MKLNRTPSSFVGEMLSAKMNRPIIVTMRSLLRSQTRFMMVSVSFSRAFRKRKGLAPYRRTGIIIHHMLQPLLTALIVGSVMESMRPKAAPKLRVRQFIIALIIVVKKVMVSGAHNSEV